MQPAPSHPTRMPHDRRAIRRARVQVKMVGDRSPLPGLSKDKVAFETEEDPLGLSEGALRARGSGFWGTGSGY